MTLQPGAPESVTVPPALDEAFLPLSTLLPALLPDLPDLVDEEMGVRSSVVGCEVTTPVELDIRVTDSGEVRLGGTPPLYHLATSILPVFHSLQVTAERVGSPP